MLRLNRHCPSSAKCVHRCACPPAGGSIPAAPCLHRALGGASLQGGAALQGGLSMHFPDDLGGEGSAPLHPFTGRAVKSQRCSRSSSDNVAWPLLSAGVWLLLRREENPTGQSSLQCPAPWHSPAATLSLLSLRFQSRWAPLSGAAHARSLFSTDHLLLRNLRDRDFPVTAATASSKRHLDAPPPAGHLPCLCPSSTAGLQERVLRPLHGVPHCPFMDTGLSQAADAWLLK